MIQELLIQDPLEAEDALPVPAKAIHVGDISISTAKLDKLDRMDVDMVVDDATSVLLSPIGVDEKDALAAFYLEAIDPFQPVESTSSSSTSPSPSSSITSTLAVGRDADRVLDKLRAKVDALSLMYYQRLNSKAQLDGNKVRLALAVEKLQRVAAALESERIALVKDTSSCRQQREQKLVAHQERLAAQDAERIPRLAASIDDSTVSDAVERCVALATNEKSNEAAVDDAADDGWRFSSEWSDGVLSYSLCKQFESSVDMDRVLEAVAGIATSSEQVSTLWSTAVSARVVKQSTPNQAVVLYDAASIDDSADVDRMLSVVFRTDAPNGDVVVGAHSITTNDVESTRECSMWQRFTRQSDGSKFSVVSGGRMQVASRQAAEALRAELQCAHLRWEALTVAPRTVV